MWSLHPIATMDYRYGPHTRAPLDIYCSIHAKPFLWLESRAPWGTICVALRRCYKWLKHEDEDRPNKLIYK